VPRVNAIEACARKPGICLFTFRQSTRHRCERARLRFGTNRLNSVSTYLFILGRASRITAYPRASFGLSIIRNGCQIPTIVHHRPRRILPRPLVAYSLIIYLSLSLTLSPPNPFKKHLFTFRIFPTVLPTAANETRQRGATRVRAQLETRLDSNWT